MTQSLTGTVAAGDFDLDVTIVEGADPVAALLRSTDDGCGSTCEGSACASGGGNV
ncbi:FxLD family lantipeptide [Kitasatospora sp. NA04385]|uniref:FxLD family lanthipeptide n=1 Tax=Kitasatospora sp. NA04385 TaxID=2742135 RepID=UPI001590A9D0|nr:FxLD family lanthipeptide [Kitasatospora sp. NA04385]QKW22278.1 FxLD family lantipeptide [Kitasatospora sp. NA04385]